jgi:hypothetical protein
MANCIGYEALYVDAVARGPTASLVQGGVACAIFFVDPESKTTAIRYRPDQMESERTSSTFIPPTATNGAPLRRGKSIVVAGEMNVRKSLFAAENGHAVVHCFYYDRVDVIDLGLDVDQDVIDQLSAIRVAVEAIQEQLREREKEVSTNGKVR